MASTSWKNGVMRFLWPDYYAAGNSHTARTVGTAWIQQKVFRRNAHVPWPVHPTTVVRAPERILRGTRTPGLAVGCYIDGRNGIEIGPNVWIGPYARLISMNHSTDDYTKYEICEPIRIERDCWIAAGATILPGVHIGRHTVVAAGAVVTRSFPEGDQVLVGIPARVLKRLPPYGSGTE